MRDRGGQSGERGTPPDEAPELPHVGVLPEDLLRRRDAAVQLDEACGGGGGEFSAAQQGWRAGGGRRVSPAPGLQGVRTPTVSAWKPRMAAPAAFASVASEPS